MLLTTAQAKQTLPTPPHQCTSQRGQGSFSESQRKGPVPATIMLQLI
uniref:Uncharacterized protein n=1 Tax=Anguilla anguilla TaxID=7936 RepID=A0A0E9R9K9_ANGAN